MRLLPVPLAVLATLAAATPFAATATTSTQTVMFRVVRISEEVEHRFRPKWNIDFGKWNTDFGMWNTHFGGSGTPVPES